MEELIKDLITQLNATGVFNWVSVWNNQHLKMINGEHYAIQNPSAFVEIETLDFHQLGDGNQGIDIDMNIHILSEELNASDGSMDSFLSIFGLRDAVVKKLSLYEAHMGGFMTKMSENQQYDHDNLYHYVLTYRMHYIDTTGAREYLIFTGATFELQTFILTGGTSGGDITGGTINLPKFLTCENLGDCTTFQAVRDRPDVYVSGGTFVASASTITFRNSTGGTFEVVGITTSGGGSGGVSTGTTLNINGVTQDLSTSREWLTSQASTGVLTFEGSSENSPSKINVGALTGYIVDNETNPAIPSYIYINYTGETGVTVPTLGSGIGSYVLLKPDNTLLFQTTFPTSKERKNNILLSKVEHASGSITLVINEPDFITSPHASYRDLTKSLKYINDGVYPYPNTGLTVNVTGGFIFGNGVNFVGDNENPNQIAVGPFPSGAPLVYRTQTGGTTGFVFDVEPNYYDLGGVITSAATTATTIQWIFSVPTAGALAVQYGQTLYNSMTDAVAAVGREQFVVYPNLVENAILIGVLVIDADATDLTNMEKAIFLRADKFGQVVGSSAGVSTSTLQSAYGNSLQPQITTTALLGSLQIKGHNGSSNILQGVNNLGDVTFTLNETGGLSANSISATTYANLPPDVYVSGGTFSGSSAIFTNTTGGSFTVTGFSSSFSDVYVTGGTVSGSTAIFTNNSGGTFTVSGFSEGGGDPNATDYFYIASFRGYYNF